MYKRYVSESHTRFEKLQQSHNFLNVLNKQNKAIKYTMGKKDQSQKLNFLDLTTINIGAGKCEFKIHRKSAITEVLSKDLYQELKSYVLENILKKN